MNPYIQIAIRTRAETIGWDVGEKFIDSLSLGGDLLVPEQVSQNADKFIEPFMGKAASRTEEQNQGQTTFSVMCFY